MKHKHADIAKAKLDNVNLVLFAKHESSDKWAEIVYHGDIAFLSDYEYFLCLPQHKEACLHWLNGGDVEYKNELAPRGWGSVSSIKESIEEGMEDGEELWSECVLFMRTDPPIRIKPRKEKRWIAYNPKSREVYNCGKENTTAEGFQIIEIEVEV